MVFKIRWLSGGGDTRASGPTAVELPWSGNKWQPGRLFLRLTQTRVIQIFHISNGFGPPHPHRGGLF